MARRINVDLPSQFSDGSPSKWPQGDYVWAPADMLYQEKLADLGKDLIEGGRVGHKYIFNELPSGYRTYTKARKDGRIDRYIFGHPNGRFDSPIKFFVHFKWMMQDGIGDCHCVNCKTPGMRNSPLPFTASAITRNKAATLEELDPCSLSAQLKRFIKILDEAKHSLEEITVPWEGPPSPAPLELLNGESFENMVTKYQRAPSFLPRKGELVIFYTEEVLCCGFEESTQQFKVFDENSEKFNAFPGWKAGVIVIEPEQQPGYEDLPPSPYERLDVLKKFFQIELYPNPSVKNRNLSSKVFLVPLHRIRPLSAYHEFLSGIPQDQWHQTIRNALKITNTIAVVDPIEFVGIPSAYSIRCRGLWMGPELFVVGDAVRLLPSQPNEGQVDQIIIINHIDQRFVNDKHSSIIVRGPLITINNKRSCQESPFITANERQIQLLPASTAGYSWYPINMPTNLSSREINSDKILDEWQEIPASYIVGRLYDADAMRKLFNVGDFDVGGLGMQKARRWAKQHGPNKGANNGQGWALAVDRIEAMGLDILNGQAVGNDIEREQVRRHKYGNGSHTVLTASSSKRRQFMEGRFSGGSLARSETSNDNLLDNEDDEDEGPLEEAMERDQLIDLDRDTHIDHSNGSPRSVKSDITDRTVSSSKTEEENTENFILEAIAGIALPQVAEDNHNRIPSRAGQDGDQNEDNSERHRPAKRPRL